jgi:hypothetical protein
MRKSLIFLSSFLFFLSSCSKEEVIPSYQLNVDVTPINGGSVSPSTGTFMKGESVQLVAKPGAEYLFKEWKGSLLGDLNPSMLVIDTDKRVTAVFQRRKYPLALEIEGEGTVDESIVTLAPEGRITNYSSGTVVRLKANPVEGWLFKSWAGDNTSSVNPLDVKVDKGVSLKAIFEKAIVKLTVKIDAGGTLEIKSKKTNQTKVVKDAQVIEYDLGDVVTVTAKSSEGYLFDGWSGAIEDRANLVETSSITINKPSEINVHFVKMYAGGKAIQNEFSDASKLNYRSSDNFIVWWDKRYDQNHKGKDLLKWAEYTRQKSMSWGMEPPLNSDKSLLNLYMHLKGNEGAGEDVFNDGWGQGVGTDRFGMPFYTAPVRQNPMAIYPNFTNVGSVIHEAFHLMQYKGTNQGQTFSYGPLDNRWYIEGSANWFEAISAKIDPVLNPSGPFDSVPSYLFQPQLALWSFGYQTNGAATWSRAVHGYGSQIFLLYLTWNKIISEDFIGKSFYSKSRLSPQEFLYTNIPNFEKVFKDFAVHIVVKDNVPTLEANAIRAREKEWLLYGKQRGNAKANGENDVNLYAFELKDQGTNGLVSPVEKPQAWSYSVTKVDNTVAKKYTVDFVGDRSGSNGTASNFHLEYVIDQAGKFTYSNVDLTNGVGSKEINVPSNSTLYLVTVSTPKLFGGDEAFNYKIKVQPN